MNNLAISPEEQLQYQQHFNNANPVNGKLSGAAARTTLMQSGLPTQQLGEIWELADIDKDGALDFDEYCVALKLVFSLLNHTIPSVPPVLPPSLIPQGKYQHFTNSLSPQLTSPQHMSPRVPPSISEAQPAKMEWYVPGEDRARFRQVFEQQARGSDQVRMLDMEDYLLSMGVSRASMTQAWGLVDVRKYQQLNREQFIYLMHILNSHMRGAQLPHVLPPAVKDAIYNSLNLTSSSQVPSKQSAMYSPDSRKPGLYGERSGNVALADSYLSKLKTSSTFKNETGSRYASAGKRAEEERKLREELKELDAQLEKLQTEYERAKGGSHDEDQLKETVEELEQLKKFKEREKLKQADGSAMAADNDSESLQDIKQAIFQLEGHLSFLMSEKRAMDEFIANGRQELLSLQMDKVKLEV
ncbi:endocytosis defective- protein [Coemansia brasiliensis]|uniref:Endocytosis protein 3 n=1 Tax=Coemansia brasiliensis TaxID=2650707 RepID=A0A9W8I5E2_9FUNG|nr:endocytosis defective- protein [Coemansia brasiliensis]